MSTAPLSTLQLELPNEAATESLGRALALVLTDFKSPDSPIGGRIHLQGELGAGKTALVRALLRASGVTGRIKSPSYALLESYKVSSLYLYHLDFYRFSDPEEWLDAGFREILTKHALVLIEWPERAGNLLTSPDLLVKLDYSGEGRTTTLETFTEKGVLWLAALTSYQRAHSLK